MLVDFGIWSHEFDPRSVCIIGLSLTVSQEQSHRPNPHEPIRQTHRLSHGPGLTSGAPCPVLTRALLGGGGGRLSAPSGFSRLAKIRRRAAPPGFHPPYPHLFRNFCENFDPMSCEVRSPGQVKWPNYKITFQSRHGYNVSAKVMKFRNKMRSSKCIPRIFDIGTSGQVIFCDLPIISQWAKNKLRYIYFFASLFEWNHIVLDSYGQSE